jgi:6-pyruvoyltetrahydropterin/6-carboxytetrahydropterin synthase
MNIVISKRIEFSAARQLAGRIDGCNFVLWVGVTGPVETDTGMIINLSDLSATIKDVLERYDHRFLNTQLDDEPTTPNTARALWADLSGRLQLDCVELIEEAGDSALVTSAGVVTIAHGAFSAAHRTHAPRLSDAENQALYGICDNLAGHGHNYQVQLFLPAGSSVPQSVWAEFDHKNLSADIPDLAGKNVVTEAVTELIARRMPQARRVRVYETADFFAEYRRADPEYRLGRRYRFNAAHRLNSLALSAEANQRIYGKCNRPEPHGHSYAVEIMVKSKLDPRTEAAYDLGQLDETAAGILSELNYTYLDADVAAFQRQPSTGENIVGYLWEKFQAKLAGALEAMRLWETPNNLFRIEPHS